MFYTEINNIPVYSNSLAGIRFKCYDVMRDTGLEYAVITVMLLNDDPVVGILFIVNIELFYERVAA